jgi:hypothetical protein
LIVEEYNLNSFIAVLIVCSSFNSPTTNHIVNHFKHHRHTKLLLIDIIGNVFSYKRPFTDAVNNTNASKKRDNLMVLSILTQKFKYILNREYHLEFSRYLNFKGSLNASTCLVQNKDIHYESLSSCEREIKERCRNHTNDEDVIKNFCMNITREHKQQQVSGGGVRLNDSTFNKQLVFSEHFNLFDFITSTVTRRNGSHVRQQYDFIVLDFRLSNNSSGVSWRPLMILEQNKIDGNAFTMHHANYSASYDDMDILVDFGLGYFRAKCGIVCYAMIAAIFLIFLGLIFALSLMVGIAAR